MFRWNSSEFSNTSSSVVGGHTLEMGNISRTSEITFGMKVSICDLLTAAGSRARNLSSLVEQLLCTLSATRYH